MHPLTELKRLLGDRPRRRTGTVLSVADGRARVATAGGVVDASLGGATVAAGQRVAIEEGVIVGRLSSAAAQVYEV